MWWTTPITLAPGDAETRGMQGRRQHGQFSKSLSQKVKRGGIAHGKTLGYRA